MRLACVVPATDRPATLERCLAAIEAAGPDELVVVTEPEGAGPAEARNLGVERCSAELIAFVDSDVVVHPQALSMMRDAFAAEPGLAAVFGGYDDRPSEEDPVSVFRNLLHHSVHLEGAGEAETFWAGLGAVRREAFEQAGGFDSDRFPWPSIEDIELGMRMRAQGRRILLDPTIQGTHLKRWTPAGMVHTDFARRGVPWARLVLESRGRGRALNLSARHGAGSLLSLLAAIAALRRRPWQALAALAALAALNRRLYGLIIARSGPGGALAGVLLHAVHHLTGIAAGLTALLKGRARGPGAPG